LELQLSSKEASICYIPQVGSTPVSSVNWFFFGLTHDTHNGEF